MEKGDSPLVKVWLGPPILKEQNLLSTSLEEAMGVLELVRGTSVAEALVVMKAWTKM